MKVEFWWRTADGGDAWTVHQHIVASDSWQEELLDHLRKDLGEVELPEFPPVEEPPE